MSGSIGHTTTSETSEASLVSKRGGMVNWVHHHGGGNAADYANGVHNRYTTLHITDLTAWTRPYDDGMLPLVGPRQGLVIAGQRCSMRPWLAPG